MSILADMLETHYRPARVQARRLARRPEERNLLALLALVCLVTFLTRLPFLVETQASAVEPLEARVAAMLIATMLFGPLFLYAVAALSHLVALALGGQGGWFQARLALIWTLFALSYIRMCPFGSSSGACWWFGYLPGPTSVRKGHASSPVVAGSS